MTKPSVILLGVTSVLVLLVSATDGLGQRNDRFLSRPTISALPQSVKAPPGNPLTADKIALGKLLFWDPILSGNRDVACATCHHPDFAWADGRALSLGAGSVGLGPARKDTTGGAIPVVRRNSPTVLNVAFNGL